MRALKYIRRCANVHVEQATVHGGYGDITIEDWKGSVVWGENEDGWEHVSVSPYDHSKMPTWDEMCAIKDIFFDDEELALQFHPRRSQYINLMENCLHLWRPKDKELLAMLEGKR